MEKDEQKQAPPPPHAATAGNPALQNFHSLLMKCAMASTPPHMSLTLPQKTFIQNRCQDFFPTIHTPDHPPYAWMIENAIRLLNEKGGSSEEAISKFILEEYKDLPRPHAALLKHHLGKLSQCGDLIQSPNGCYSSGKASVSRCRASRPSLRLTRTTRRSPSLHLSSCPSSSSSSSPTYASSSSYSFSKERNGRKKRNYKRKRTQRGRQNARGIKIHPMCKEGSGRGRGRGRGRGTGRGRGRGRGRSRGRGRERSRGQDWSCCNPGKENMLEEVDTCQVQDEQDRHCMDTIAIQHIMIEDEESDGNIRGKEQTQEQEYHDYANVECQAQPSMVVHIEPLEQDYRVSEETMEPMQQNIEDNCFTLGTIPWSCRRKLASGQGSRIVHSGHTPKTGKGGRRPGRRETGKNMELLETTAIGALNVVDKQKICLMNQGNTANKMEGENQYVDLVEQDEEDSLDELIEEVYREFKEATETPIDGEASEGNLQMKEHHEESANVDCQAEPEPSTMIIEIGPQQEYIVSEEINESEQQNLDGGDNSTAPWSHYKNKLISEQGQEQGRRKGTLRRSSQLKHTPQTMRGRGGTHKQIEATRKITESLEVTKIGELMVENEQETGDQSLLREGQTGWIEIRDCTQGMQNQINQQSAADQTYIINDVEPQEHESKLTDNPIGQQLEESNFAKVAEQNHLKEDQGSWTGEQNLIEIHVQESKGAMEGQIQLEDDKDEGLKGQQSHIAQIQDGIRKMSLMDQISERSNVDLHEQEFQFDDNLDEQQLKDNECSGNPTVKEVTEKHFKTQTWQPKLTLVGSETQIQESYENEQQDQLKGGQMDIMGLHNICEGECPRTEKEMEKEFEDLEEQNQQTDQSEVISEGNQPEELHCFLVDPTRKDIKEVEHCDELNKLESENSEEQFPSDTNPHKQHNQDQKQQLEQRKKLSSEQPLETAEHDQPIQESERMGTENVGANIDENETSQHREQTPVEPPCRKLRPRPTKFQPDQTEERSDHRSLEKSSETDQRSKLRPRPSRNVSSEVANRSRSLAARPELQKGQELAARRSLRH